MFRKSLRERILALLLALVMTVFAVPVGVSAEEKQTAIQIVHTNDIHGYYTVTKSGTLGFAVLKSIVDASGADLVLDAGDTFHGQAFATLEKGQSIAELMDYVGYDATTPGNHDWSYGADALKEFDAQNSFKILAANVVNEKGEGYFESPYLVKDVTADDGTKLKVGVLGVIDDSFYTSTVSENVARMKQSRQRKQQRSSAMRKSAILS